MQHFYKYIFVKIRSPYIYYKVPSPLCKKAVFLQIYICKIRSRYIYYTGTIFLRKNAVFLQIYFCKNPVPKYISKCSSPKPAISHLFISHTSKEVTTQVNVHFITLINFDLRTVHTKLVNYRKYL